MISFRNRSSSACSDSLNGASPPSRCRRARATQLPRPETSTTGAPILGDSQWPPVQRELRLPYAVGHNIEPGMWLPSDVESKPEDRSSWGRLWNLG